MNISVIIPVYNVERFIERCVTSIMNQTYTESVECIIVNDCTPDRSMEIVEGLVAQYNGSIQFKILYHQHNRGLAAARNTGLYAATGEYLLNIDSDDYCELNMLEEMYTKAIEEDADIVIADYWLTGYENDVYSLNIVPKDNIGRMKDTLLGKLPGYVWCKLIRHSIFTDNNMKSKEGVDFREDMLMTFLLFYYAPKVVHLSKAFVHYVQYNNESYTQKVMSKKNLEDILEGEKIIVDFVLKKTDLIVPLKSAVLGMRMNNLWLLLLCSDGELQKKWCLCYNDLTLSDILKYTSSGIMSTVSICFAVCGMLPIYNLMRTVWRLIKRKRSAHIVIYQN